MSALAWRREEVVHRVYDSKGKPLLAEHTPDEPWYADRAAAEREGHVYAVFADFALETLGAGAGRSCLVIGSPLFEALELHEAGWAVTYLDIRKPPLALRWVEGDATAMPFGGARFDAVSSNCVLCHVGLGRYGDAKTQNGDFAMLHEIARVLRPGGTVAITVGPAADCGHTRRMGTIHRVYVPADVFAMVAAAGLELVHSRALNSRLGIWRSADEALTAEPHLPDYLTLQLRKPEA